MELIKKIHVGIVCDQFGNLDRGGAEVQVDNTLNALNKIEGITTELISSQTKELERFDIIHFFKSSIGYSPLVNLLIKKKIPYVVSTIIFPENYFLDLLKYGVGRYIPIVNKISWVKFQYMLWNNAAMLFPNTDKELQFLRDVGVKTPARIIPNGLVLDEMDSLADEGAFYEQFSFLRNEIFVLNVARIDKRKNQARLVQACKELDVPIVIIGNNIDPQEYAKIQKIGYSKLHYLGPIFDKRILFGAYKACSLFCLPSTMETPGIAAMEAAYFNKPVVITKFGGTEYYFKDNAYYVDWRSVKEIVNGIQNALAHPNVQTRKIIEQYNWDRIASLYLNEYKKIIK